MLSSMACLAYRLAIRRNALVFYHNSDDRDLFVSKGICPSEKARVIGGSGIDLTHYHPIPDAQLAFDFIFIGRLLADKGIREFLGALDILRAKGHAPRAIILGERDSNPTSLSEDELAQWRKKGIAEFRGQVEDVRPFLAQSLTLVLPSYREGMPRSVLEAMALGRAVIASDVPGCRHAVTNGVNGLLVPARDPKALADAMEILLLSRELAQEMGRKGLTIAKQQFDVSFVNADLISQMEL
jgi:glycosyltransferase involved in cell wall biosynthesis